MIESRLRHRSLLRVRAYSVELGVGVHGFEKARLAQYRARVADETSGAALEMTVKRLDKAGFRVGGEKLQEVVPWLRADLGEARSTDAPRGPDRQPRNENAEGGGGEDLPNVVREALAQDAANPNLASQ